jgi:hypothetical protein
MPKLLGLVLRPGRGFAQRAVAVIGLAVGMTILLGAFDMFLGLNRLLETSARESDYLILNKRVSMAGTLTYIRPTFTNDEIADIRSQPFIADVGAFKTNQFRASAATDMGNQNTSIPGMTPAAGAMPALYTELFFESVPDRFLDIDPLQWEWTGEEETVPIIMSRDFLNLYNFAFALAQGLPQLPESMMGMTTGSIGISGANGRKVLNARVVGLSNRIPSIVVPESFMDWANKTVANKPAERPSRLIVRVSDPGHPDLISYFQNHGIQVNTEHLGASRAAHLLRAALSVIGGTGALFVVLAITVFGVLLRLTLIEAKTEIELLLQLGYAPGTLARHVLRRYILLLGATVTVVLVALHLGLTQLYALAADSGIQLGQSLKWQTVTVALLLILIAIAANTVMVLRTLATKSKRWTIHQQGTPQNSPKPGDIE